jgi:acetyltransferase-like isoleucine patch superfamily enzyme
MPGPTQRLLAKLRRMLFAAHHRSRFAHLGSDAFLFPPYRIDGEASIKMGNASVLQRGGWLYCVGIGGRRANLEIGEGCVFGYNNHITAVEHVRIGNHVLTANNVYISDNVHSFDDPTRPIMHQPIIVKGRVEIGDGCWLGENVAVIGARIGKNCVIGANAVVTKDIPDFSVAVGIPAKVIRHYDPRLESWINV